MRTETLQLLEVGLCTPLAYLATIFQINVERTAEL
jgi:hypothetical protein